MGTSGGFQGLEAGVGVARTGKARTPRSRPILATVGVQGQTSGSARWTPTATGSGPNRPERTDHDALTRNSHGSCPPGIRQTLRSHIGTPVALGAVQTDRHGRRPQAKKEEWTCRELDFP